MKPKDRLVKPKFVKKANQWVITIKTRTDKGMEKFQQYWFSTKDEAFEFSLKAQEE